LLQENPMSRFQKFAFVTALFGSVAMLSAVADAALIISNGAEQYAGTGNILPSTGMTQAIAANSAWAPNNAFGTGSQWISYANTTNSGPSLNSDLTVTEKFNVLSPTKVLVQALADDTAKVRLLDSTNAAIYTFNFNLTDPNGPCQLGVIGCIVTPNNYSLGALVTLAAAGLYTLEVTARQLVDGTPFGLQYSVSAVPLPGAALLFGSALAGLGWIRRGREPRDGLSAAVA